MPALPGCRIEGGEMKKEYDIFVDALADLPEGRELNLTVRDLAPGPRKYEARYVKAIVSSKPEQMPEAATLWVRFQRGHLHPHPWAINILEQLGEYEVAAQVGIIT